MKRNITVNMFGTLYPMDEDAYELLKRYTDNMRAYFHNQEGGDEIADDIEARIAELMNEMLATGAKAVAIEDVQEIICRIGNPEEMDADAGENTPTPPPVPDDRKPRKRLFRDVDHKFLGGVMSGLGCYLDINPMWLRLLAIILAFGSYGTALIIYLICWAIIPPATTPAERLEMKGDPVNPYSLGDEILNDARNAMDSVKSSSAIDNVLQVLCSIVKVMLYIAGAGIMVVCGIVLLATLVGLCWFLLSPLSEVKSAIGTNSELDIIQTICSPILLWGAVISFIVALSLTLYAGIHLLLRVADRVSPMSTTAKWTCITVWLASVVLCSGAFMRIAYTIDANENLFRKNNRTEKEMLIARQELEQIKELESRGWRVADARNLNGKYMTRGRHYTGNKDLKYLNAWTTSGDFVYEVVRDVKVAPGTYTLEAIARTDGNGCEIFAVNGSGKRFSAPVPICDNIGGSVWSDAKKALEADTTMTANRKRLKKIAKANNGDGYGWSYVKISGIKVGPDSTLTYGVTNNGPSTAWDGTWLSATSFQLIPEKK